MTLEWVGSLPGKREYRRFLGDYVLHQGDILGQTEFADRVAFGGWSIDLHPPQGMYAAESGAKQRYADGIYHIPYRSLYSVNTSNLLFAGRNISASHVAFGSTRVMATCATIGQAAGTAAALCAAEGVTPRELEVAALQRTLLREDASVIGLASTDPADLALRATATASSTLTALTVETPQERWPLTADAGLVLPADPELTGLQLLVDAERGTELVIELYDPELGQNYVPRRLVSTSTVQVAAGEKQWVETPRRRRGSSSGQPTEPRRHTSSPCAHTRRSTRVVTRVLVTGAWTEHLARAGRALGLLPLADRAEGDSLDRLRILGGLPAQHALGIRRFRFRCAGGHRGRPHAGRLAVRLVHAHEPTHPRSEVSRQTTVPTAAATAAAQISGRTGTWTAAAAHPGQVQLAEAFSGLSSLGRTITNPSPSSLNWTASPEPPRIIEPKLCERCSDVVSWLLQPTTASVSTHTG